MLPRKKHCVWRRSGLKLRSSRGRRGGTVEAEKAEVNGLRLRKRRLLGLPRKRKQRKKTVKRSRKAKQLVQAPLKETPSGRKNLKSKDRRAQEREERAELHVARDKSGRRRKGIPQGCC